MAIKMVRSFILAIKKRTLFLMSTKADTPISALSLSPSLILPLSNSLPPSNHQLHSLRVVTTLLTLHSGVEGSEFNTLVRAHTHTQTHTHRCKSSSWWTQRETNLRCINWLLMNCRASSLSSHLWWLVSWGMHKLLYNKAKKKERGERRDNYSSHAMPQSLIKMLAVAFMFSFFRFFSLKM